MWKLQILILIASILALTSFLSACGGSETAATGQDALATQVALGVQATLTAEAGKVTSTKAPTDTSLPPTETLPPTATSTETDTPTPIPTDTPAPPTETRAPTTTPWPTDTPAPTITPTPRPGIGSVLQCGDLWAVSVLEPPYIPSVVDETPKGQWLGVLFALTNLQDKTAHLRGGDLALEGTLGTRTVTFEQGGYGVSIRQKGQGISDWSDDIPPGITTKLSELFDVNPSATDLFFVLKPEVGFEEVCRVRISLALPGAPTASAVSEGQLSVAVAQVVNVRSGPATSYPVIGKTAAMGHYAVTGKNTDASWWQIDLAGKKGWIAASVASPTGPLETVAVIKGIAPPSTAAPKPTPVPLSKVVPLGQEFQTTLWGLKLYDVKRAKAVYWFDEAEIAHGTWLIPLVEFRNLGSGTAAPHNNLNFYLQDDKGRTFTYDPFNDAVLGAAWQFKAGHLYDDINPGSVLGVALPFDVTPDLGNIWLRIKEAPNVVMYLGNVSQMPESK